ncbi:hypothetical protein CHUAL_011690 [Chamberlinius hualienensis]
MIWLNGFIFFICPLIDFQCFGLSIPTPKFISEAESLTDNNNNNQPIDVLQVHKEDDDDILPLNLTHSLLKVVDDDDPMDDIEPPKEMWDQFNYGPFMRPYSRPNSHRIVSAVVLTRPIGWPSHRPLPIICMAGPSTFSSCCHRINQLLNDENVIKKFCMNGKCCNVTSKAESTSSLAENVTTDPPIQKIVTESNQPIAASTKPSTASQRVTVSSEDVKQSIMNKVKQIKNMVKTKFSLKSKDSTKMDSKAAKSAEISNELVIGEAAVVSKLQKMRGKGKTFLSREEVDIEENEDAETTSGEDEESYDASSSSSNEDSFADDGTTDSTDNSKNSSKSEVQLKAKKSGSSKQTEDSGEDISSEEQSEIISTGSASDETSQGNDGSSSDSEQETDSEDGDQKFVSNVKTYPRVYVKNRLQLINRAPKKFIMTTEAPLESLDLRTNATEALETLDAGTSKNGPTEADNAGPAPSKKNDGAKKKVDTTAAQKTDITLQKGYLKVQKGNSTAQLADATAPDVDPIAPAKKADAAIKKTDISPLSNPNCPKDRGGPNCTIDITGAITSNGYYAVNLSKALSRAEAVKDCANRNMTLAFLTNHHEDRLLRRLVVSNNSYWIGLAKQAKGNQKGRYQWEDGNDPGTYISRYIILDHENLKSKTDGNGIISSCILKLVNGKMKVECSAEQSMQAAIPLCMYRPALPSIDNI